MTVTRHTKNSKTKKGRWPENYRSQGWAANQLGVTRPHLNRVLRGHRQSRSLLARYQKLISEQ